MSAGKRVVPEAHPFDDARGDGDDVLQRAANLDADDVGRAVQAQIFRSQLLLNEPDDSFVLRGDNHGRRHTFADLDGEARSGNDGDRKRRACNLANQL